MAAVRITARVSGGGAGPRTLCHRPGPAPPPVFCPQGSQQVAAVSSVCPATPFQSVPPTVSQTPVIAATPVPTITANVTSVPVPPAAAPPPPATPIIPVVPPTPPVVKVSFPGPGWGSGGALSLPWAQAAPGTAGLWTGPIRPWGGPRFPTATFGAAGHTAGEGGWAGTPASLAPVVQTGSRRGVQEGTLGFPAVGAGRAAAASVHAPPWLHWEPPLQDPTRSTCFPRGPWPAGTAEGPAPADVHRLLRFDPHSNPRGQAVFPPSFR